MCFNGHMSGSLAVAGFAAAYYARQSGRVPAAVWMCCAYFAIMELLQAALYPFLGECPNGTGWPFFINQVLTVIAYIHIVFQPLVINNWFEAFSSHPLPTREYAIVKKLCFAAALFYLRRLLIWSSPLLWPVLDDAREPGAICQWHNETTSDMCWHTTCSYAGTYHLASGFQLRAAGYMSPSVFLHGFLWFVPALILGPRKMSAAVFVFGPLLARVLVRDINEMAAIWCLTSVPVILLSMWMAWQAPPPPNPRLRHCKQPTMESRSNQAIVPSLPRQNWNRGY